MSSFYVQQNRVEPWVQVLINGGVWRDILRADHDLIV